MKKPEWLKKRNKLKAKRRYYAKHRETILQKRKLAYNPEKIKIYRASHKDEIAYRAKVYKQLKHNRFIKEQLFLLLNDSRLHQNQIFTLRGLIDSNDYMYLSKAGLKCLTLLLKHIPAVQNDNIQIAFEHLRGFQNEKHFLNKD